MGLLQFETHLNKNNIYNFLTASDSGKDIELYSALWGPESHAVLQTIV